MANSDTVKAITANLAAIMAAQGFNNENSSTDPSLQTVPASTVNLKGEDYENLSGERMSYNTLRFEIDINSNDSGASASRDRVAIWAHKVREAVTVNALNTGALAASKLVSKVEHDGYDSEYSPPSTRVTCRIKVRYRET